MVKFCGKYVAVFATCLAFLFIACEDKDLSKSGIGEEPSLLDYSTTQSVKFNLVYDVPEGYVSTFDVYSENPFIEEEFKISSEAGAPTVTRLTLNPNLTPISGGISISGKYNLNKTIPSYVKDLYVHSTSMFVPTLMKATIQSGVANFEIVNLSGDATRASLPTTRTLADKRPDYFIRHADGKVAETTLDASNDLYFPGDGAVGPNHEPYIAFHEEVPANVYNNINLAFPEKVKADPKYLSGTSTSLTKPAKVWISIIHTNGTQWDNALGYFYHPTNALNELIHEQRTGLTNKEIIAVPLAKLKATDSKLSLTSGDYVQLQYFNEDTQSWQEEFPAGLTIGWMLHPKSYVRGKQYLTSGGWQWPLHSINTLNTDNHRIDCIVFNAGTEQEPFVCVGFEDDYRRNNYPSADEDFNDVMFHIKTDPATAIEPVPEIPKEEDVKTTVTKNGILAFEDNWPSEGDYDLNDVVVQYSSKATLTCRVGESVTYVTKLEDRFSLIHNGGVFFNKFGYKVDIDPSYVESITINGSAYTPVPDKFDGNNGFIVDLCENIQSYLARYTSGVTPKDYNIVIKLKDGITESQWETVCAPYNPFITPKDNIEVHLPHYSPTNRADLSLFGKGHDKSDVEKKIYYVSGDKVLYPFALHLSGVDTFINLEEKQRINDTYPNYDKWVKSNGTEHRDWYLK